MSTLSLRLGYRPLRLGWCVADGDWDAIRRSARTSLTMWGGRFNPIIPVGEPDLADALIRLFRVDALVAISPEPALLAFTNLYAHLPTPFSGSALFFNGHHGHKEPRIVDLSHPIARFYENDYKHNPTPEPCVDLYEWDDADPLADMFLCTYGSVPPVADVGLDYPGLLRQHLLAATKIIRNGAEIPPLEASRMTLASFGSAFVERHHAVRNHWDYPGFFIGDAGNFDDVVTFWNLRAADIALQFYDPAFAPRLQHLKQFWMNASPSLPRSSVGPHGLALWFREMTDVGDVGHFGEKVTRCSIGAATWNGLNLQVPIMQFAERPALGAISSTDGKTSVSFALTNQPFTEQWNTHHQHYVLSVDPGIGLFRNEEETLHTPFIPALNEFYGRNCHFSWNKARAEPGSLGIVTALSATALSLRALRVGPLITEVFRTVGIEAAPSKAGLVASTLIRQMGGLSGCRSFKIAGVRALIEGHRPDQSFSRSDAMQTIRGNDTAKPLSDYQWLYIEPRGPGEKLKNDNVLAYLLDKGVFRAGLKFDCPNCRLEFWRSLDDATARLECDYCGHTFNASKQLRDKDWAFRRSGLFGRDDHQEGAIPVTLALQQLMDMSMLDEGLFTTAMTLKPAGAAISPCETDFVVVNTKPFDKRIQIVIGECKSRKAITAADVENLTAVADAFPADSYDVYIAFARLTPFTPEEIELIRPINTLERKRAILFTDRELEPMFVFEAAAKLFPINQAIVSFGEMALASDTIFLQQPEANGTA